MTEPLKNPPPQPRPSGASGGQSVGGNGGTGSTKGPRIASGTPDEERPGGGGGSGGGGGGGGGPMKMPPIDQLKGRPLGRVLIKMGRLTREQVHQALALQAEQKKKGTSTPIGQILVDLGMISDRDRNLALAA